MANQFYVHVLFGVLTGECEYSRKGKVCDISGLVDPNPYNPNENPHYLNQLKKAILTYFTGKLAPTDLDIMNLNIYVERKGRFYEVQDIDLWSVGVELHALTKLPWCVLFLSTFVSNFSVKL